MNGEFNYYQNFFIVKIKMFFIKIFGKKLEVQDNGTSISAYRFMNKIYFELNKYE